MDRLRPAMHWLGWSPVAAVLVAAVLVAAVLIGARGCTPSLPGPPTPVPVPEPAVPREPGNRFPDDAPDPPPAHDFKASEPPPPQWEWRDLGPGWTVPVEGYGRDVDGQFLYFQIRKKGGASVQSVETGKDVE